ncbi:MAG: aldo/keto reductase [Acidobacteriota bacterium]|nr:aldo/keto reductase [Blastocatellia bacterium]MDW8238028.1 aldo/keto reductase [Acidobacteriota bacterium]
MTELYATEVGTARYRARFDGLVADGHFRRQRGLWLSSIGLGTYLGEADEATDARYHDAVVHAVQLGCNVIDSAINYRFQRSERAIGQALRTLFSQGQAKRDELIISTKGGYIPFDGAPPPDLRRYFQETFFDTGIITPSDLAGGGWHCLAPAYLQHQLEASRRNLGLACIDIYYLHNPEQQLGDVSRDEFHTRMRAAFELLEQCVNEGKIRLYGTATWNGYRQPPTAPDFLSLDQLLKIARDVAGVDHHFRVIQLPYNLGMTEAFGWRNQPCNGDFCSTLELAARHGMIVMASASILQGRLTRQLPADLQRALPSLETDAQRAIQFVRSTPGVTTALVGMSRVAHVQENLRTAQVAPAPLEDFMKLFVEESE